MNRQADRRPALIVRARILQAVRRYFSTAGYLEVETPLLVPAPAPEAHIDPLPAGSGYLHTSPELCMKRLLAAGYPRIFQICRCFRKGERGHRHLPEFTLLEWYRVQSDYRHLMDECQELVGKVSRALGRAPRLEYRGTVVDTRPPWERMTVEEAFARFAGISPEQALAADRFDEILGVTIEPRLGRRRPVFLYDYPAACGALARSKPGNPALAERFELYIAGMEMCNGFSELTDAAEQRRRFEAERLQREAAGRPVTPMPERFLESLASIPAAAGNALGLDRLVMLFADRDRIDDVSAFTPEEL